LFKILWSTRREALRDIRHGVSLPYPSVGLSVI